MVLIPTQPRAEGSLSTHGRYSLSSVDDWTGAVEQYSTFIPGNGDLETAEYLMANEDFQALILSDYGSEMPAYLLDDICNVANLVSYACGFLWQLCIPCWIICVPAAGVALACTIAGFFID